MDRYLAIDIGGTFMKYSIMNGEYEVQEEGDISTGKEPEAFERQLLALMEKYKKTVSGIAVCIGGFIHPETGENTDFSVNSCFRAFNIKERLEEASGLPVVLENDSNCALLGEMVAGAGRESRNVLLLTIGTGIGGAIAIDGKLYRGGHFKAGEAGFMWTGEKQAKATAALVRKASSALGKEVDGKYIFEHMDAGDEEAGRIRAVYEEWLNRLAPVVGNSAVLLDPEVILIGGGICRQERFIRDLREKVYDKFSHLEEYTDIRACETGNLAGRIGALSLLKLRLADGNI